MYIIVFFFLTRDTSFLCLGSKDALFVKRCSNFSLDKDGTICEMGAPVNKHVTVADGTIPQNKALSIQNKIDARNNKK